MPHPVIDLGSNLEENLERWSNSLKYGGEKLEVFGVIYSGKREFWTPKDISSTLKGRISSKRVTECGKKLVGEGLIRQDPEAWPVVYQKIAAVHHYKRRLLSLVKNKAKRTALPTKRKAQVTVRVRGGTERAGKAFEVTIEDVDQFSKVRRKKDNAMLLKPLPESIFKSGLQKLFRETGTFKDWGGEKDDFFTNKLEMKGKRYSAAFALKGPGVRAKSMSPGQWGKRGNQIQRLVEAPARVFFLQFEGQINEDSIDQLKKLTEHKAYQEGRKLFYGFIEQDDSLRLRRAYPKYF